MGSKNKPGSFDCYNAAEADEPMFILLGRDTSAGSIVRVWARERVTRNTAAGDPSKDLDKVEEALACASALDDWAIQKGKTPQGLVILSTKNTALDTIATACALLAHTLTLEERQSENPPGLLERIRRLALPR